MKQQILVDMDGVLANTYAQYIALEYKRSGKMLAMEDLRGKSEERAFPSYEEDVNSINFFGTAPLIEDSIEGLQYLNDKYKVIIVSSATENANLILYNTKSLFKSHSCKIQFINMLTECTYRILHHTFPTRSHVSKLFI